MRGQRDADGADRLIAELAGRQHGVVARRQLVALGIGSDAIDRRVRAGRLHTLHRAVYAGGHTATTKESRWMAAVLASGPDAVLSHAAAAAHWGIRSSGATTIDVTVPRNRRPPKGVVLHRTILPADEITTKDGIPITTVPRTLFDIAPDLDLRRLERAINEAEILRLFDALSLDDLLDRYPRRSGSRNVRAALQARRAGAHITESDLEVLFLSFADRHGLPAPETNTPVEEFSVDCVWRSARLVLELDSWEFHSTRLAFERDRRKVRVLQARGWHCIPVTYRHLTETGDEVAADVRRLLHAATLAA
jgi:very-short-patch-repair endonuclease